MAQAGGPLIGIHRGASEGLLCGLPKIRLVGRSARVLVSMVPGRGSPSPAGTITRCPR
jgi:hypothetical protein